MTEQKDKLTRIGHAVAVVQNYMSSVLMCFMIVVTLLSVASCILDGH